MTKKNPTGDDDDLFRSLMSDVKPLAVKPRIAPRKPSVSPHPKPQHSSAAITNHFSERQNIASVAADEQLNFSRAGPQRRQLQRLRRGELPCEGRLDLHGQTIAEAGTALGAFLHAARQARQRCVLIVHGKGHRSASALPVLKSQLNRWLQDEPDVLAFHSAQPRHGGTGAVYVLLRRETALE